MGTHVPHRQVELGVTAYRFRVVKDANVSSFDVRAINIFCAAASEPHTTPNRAFLIGKKVAMTRDSDMAWYEHLGSYLLACEA